MFTSRAAKLMDVTLPAYSGVRVMMMPFLIDRPITSLMWLGGWRETVAEMLSQYKGCGVGYLTIDEATVQAGETHRRPGKHVDGVGPDGQYGGWGGGGGYAGNGMLMVASVPGVKLYLGTFVDNPGPNGDCSEVSRAMSVVETRVPKAGEVYWCDSLCMHEAIPMAATVQRQFCRISYPSNAPWYEGYTENPLGVKPTGPVHPRRVFMDYRP